MSGQSFSVPSVLGSECSGEAPGDPAVGSAFEQLICPVLDRGAVDDVWYPLVFVAFCLQLKGPQCMVSSHIQAFTGHWPNVHLVSS